MRLCYDPLLSEKCGKKLSELFSEHLRSLQKGEKEVQSWVEPAKNISKATEMLVEREGPSSASFSENSDPEVVCLERFEKLIQACLEKSQGLHHPTCVGHQVPAVMPLAGWFDSMTSLTNQVQGVYEMGPWSVSVERAVLDSVAEVLGYQGSGFGALVTSGGSLANLTALLAARKVRFPDVWSEGFSFAEKKPAVVVHRDAHYCVERAVGVMGLGTKQIIPVPLDADRRMSVSDLQRILEDLQEQQIPVLAVVSVAGSTATGAFDPLVEIADVCRSHDVWLHVDAAHGGALRFSEKHCDLVSGLHLADSVVVDAHKMFFVPAVCAMLFFKNPEHKFAAFDQSAPYLFDPSEPSLALYDNAVVTMECTKRASALGLWGVWSMFGSEIFGHLVECVMNRAFRLNELLIQSSDFESPIKPSCNIVVFRCCGVLLEGVAEHQVDEFHLRVRRELLESGAGYLTQTKLDGQIYLRATIMNPMIEEDDLENLLDQVRLAVSRVKRRW